MSFNLKTGKKAGHLTRKGGKRKRERNIDKTLLRHMVTVLYWDTKGIQLKISA